MKDYENAALKVVNGVFLLQQVKDRTCLRALEKIKIQLEKGNEEYDDQAVAAQHADSTVTASQTQDGNNTLTGVFVRFCPFHLKAAHFFLL